MPNKLTKRKRPVYTPTNNDGIREGRSWEKQFPGETMIHRAVLSKKLVFPELPVGDMPPNDYSDALTTVVANMMRKGVSSPHRMRALLGGNVTLPTLKNCIRKVHKRWEIEGGVNNPVQAKGEQLTKLRLVEEHLWAIFDTSKGDDTKQMNLLRMVLQVNDQISILQGLKSGGGVNITNINSISTTSGHIEIEHGKQIREVALQFRRILAEQHQNVIAGESRVIG